MSMPILDRVKIAKYVSLAKEQADFVPDTVEVELGCADHEGAGVRVFYENGVLLLRCVRCDKLSNKIAVAVRHHEPVEAA